MPRIKRGVTTRAKHKRLLDQAKGYRGRRKNTHSSIALQAVEIGLAICLIRDRKVKKRTLRRFCGSAHHAAFRMGSV